MGEVYRAKDPQLGREVAIKVSLIDIPERATWARDNLSFGTSPAKGNQFRLRSDATGLAFARWQLGWPSD
jgi:hypothetical protein